MNDWLKKEMVNFVEEHWAAFIERCEECGIPREDVEKEINRYKSEK